MSSQSSSEEDPHRFEVHVTADSHFSWLRTRMSLDRTLMSWVRTATAMIGFGFTIVQFFERLASMEGVAPALWPQAPRYIGLALIAAGVVALAISIWQYRMVVRYLWSAPYRVLAGVREDGMQAPVLGLAIFLMIVGVLAFAGILLRFV
jgi:putative membrane protein